MLIDRDKAIECAQQDMAEEWSSDETLAYQTVERRLLALPPAVVTEAMVDRALDAFRKSYVSTPDGDTTKAMRAALIAAMGV